MDTQELTLVFCCNALFTNARYISLRYFSSCFTREFVAIGRGINKYEDPADDLDDFVDAIGRFENLSRMGFDCGSVKRTAGVVGPLFGTLLLY
jgi:hypothetical protein